MIFFNRLVIIGLLCCLLVTASFSHICTIIPSQRGGYNISQPGESACFAPTPPCGGATPWWPRPIGPPVLSILGGTTFRVLFQQNLNHYNVGFPGLLQVGFSCGINQTSDADFQPLARTPDQWQHFQATQTNYSLPILFPPQTNCPHGTLQVIYNPHKPEEPIFHECSDVAIVPSDPLQVSKLIHGQLLGLFQAGLSYANVDSMNGVVKTETALSGYQLLIGTATASGNIGYFFGRDTESSMTNLLVPYFPASALSQGHVGDRINIATPVQTDGITTFQWVALSGSYNNMLLAIGMLGNTSSGDYYYQLYTINPQTTETTFVQQSISLGKDVNFMWTTFDPTSSQVIILTGNEDSTDELLAAFVVFVLGKSPVQTWKVAIDVSSYTFQSFQSIDGHVFALSPGLVADGPLTPHAWSLVRVDQSSGLILSAQPLSSTPINSGESYLPTVLGRYEGGIHNGITAAGFIAQVLYRADDNQPLLCYVDPSTAKIQWSTYLSSSLSPDSLLFILN